jgi:hypothetical protein
MHGLQCIDYNAWIIMCGLQCMDYNAWITMHGLQAPSQRTCAMHDVS